MFTANDDGHAQIDQAALSLEAVITCLNIQGGGQWLIPRRTSPSVKRLAGVSQMATTMFKMTTKDCYMTTSSIPAAAVIAEAFTTMDASA